MKLLAFFVGFATAASSAAFVPTIILYRPIQVAASRRLCSASIGAGTNLIDISEHAPRDIQAMEEWAMACGVQTSEGFQLVVTEEEVSDGVETYTTSASVSAITNEDLPADTTVLYIPSEMIFSAQQVVAEVGAWPLQEAEQMIELGADDDDDGMHQQQLLNFFYLMIKVLMEYEKGDQSPWYPYLNYLPRYYSTGASMTSFCFSCLPPLVATLAMKEQSNLLLLRAAMDMVPSTVLTDETKDNTDLVTWAFHVANTRSIGGMDGDLRIAPMSDVFNHGSIDTEIGVYWDQDGNCYAQTIYDVPAGTPLRFSYGDPTNPSYLLSKFGFLDESSPATFCKIMIPEPVSEELQTMGYAHNRMLFYKDTGDVSEEVFDVLLYQLLEDYPEDQQALYNAHVQEDYDTKTSLHEQYWSETSAQLLQHIDGTLNELNKLSSKAIGKDLKAHPRLPLILKHNEFVKNTFLAVKARYFE